jgi:hypothetical protein
MPRKDFIRAFPGNETNLGWVDEMLKRKQKWSSGLRDVKDQIVAEQEADHRHREGAVPVAAGHQGDQPRDGLSARPRRARPRRRWSRPTCAW